MDKSFFNKMTKQELIVLAAKAAGIPRFETKYGKTDWFSDPKGGMWYPFLDDGALYRLAKQLDIQIHWGPQYVSYVVGGIPRITRWPEDAENDVYAIMISAAEIGANMP